MLYRLDKDDGLPRRCVVNLDDIATIPKPLLDKRLTVLSERRMREIDRAIRFALALD